jgi:hypothetical protein
MYNSDQFFSYLQDENKFNYIQKPHGNEESEVWRVGYGRKK